MILVLVLRMTIDLDTANLAHTHQWRGIDDMHTWVGGTHRVEQGIEKTLARQMLFERSAQSLGRSPDAGQARQSVNGALALQRYFLEQPDLRARASYRRHPCL